jgi:hypothetical protein
VGEAGVHCEYVPLDKLLSIVIITIQPKVLRFIALYHGERREGRGGPRESVLVLIAGDLTEQVIGLAIEVHRHTGPGLLESLYEQCFK